MGQHGSHDHHGAKDETDGAPGTRKLHVSYTSHMTGHINKGGSKHPCSLEVTIESDDIVHMIVKDPSHSARISGEIVCPFLTDAPIPFSGGRFYVESSSDENLRFKSMVYETLLPWGEKDYFFKGMRVAHEETFVGEHVTDSTSMGIVLKSGPSFKAPTLATGSVEVKLVDMAEDVKNIEITGSDDELLRFEWKARFGYLIGGPILDTSDLFCPTQFCPTSHVRERRPLNLNGTTPEIYHFTAKDGVPLVMTRYKCGSKGPILFLHGLCVTGRIFSLDTIDKSVVEFFCEHGFDMWVPELRFSVALPSHRKPTHINDSAEHDLPPIIDFILKATGAPDLQIYAHCIGSLTIHVALFGGHVDRKHVRSLVASQSGFCMISTSMNHAKANVRMESIGTSFGFSGLNAYTDKNDHPREKVMTVISKMLARSTLTSHNQCNSTVCKRITLMFGLMWEHSNLNTTTHDTLTEWFGFGHAEYYRHLAMTFRKGRLTDIKGHDVYIPDFNAKRPLDSPKYRAAMKNLDIPILYYVGAFNQGWDIEATRQSFLRCQEANPRQHYEWFKVPLYGHLDCIMGKEASMDVYPRILPFLQKFATPAPVLSSDSKEKSASRERLV